MSRWYTRQARRKAIERKSKIASSVFQWSPEYLAEHKAHLAKGKVHCSCPICSCKSTKIAGKTTNNKACYSKQDQARIMAMQDEILDDDYLSLERDLKADRCNI